MRYIVWRVIASIVMREVNIQCECHCHDYWHNASK